MMSYWYLIKLSKDNNSVSTKYSKNKKSSKLYKISYLMMVIKKIANLIYLPTYI